MEKNIESVVRIWKVLLEKVIKETCYSRQDNGRFFNEANNLFPWYVPVMHTCEGKLK